MVLLLTFNTVANSSLLRPSDSKCRTCRSRTVSGLPRELVVSVDFGRDTYDDTRRANCLLLAQTSPWSSRLIFRDRQTDEVIEGEPFSARKIGGSLQDR
jgi:hypothetical protein